MAFPFVLSRLPFPFGFILETDSSLKSASQSKVVDTREMSQQNNVVVPVVRRGDRRTDLFAGLEKETRRNRPPLPTQRIEFIGHGKNR